MSNDDDAFLLAGAMMLNSFVAGYKDIPKKSKKRTKPVYDAKGKKKRGKR